MRQLHAGDVLAGERRSRARALRLRARRGEGVTGAALRTEDDPARGRIVKRADQADDRGLSCTRGSYKRRHASRLSLKTDVFEHGLAGVIPETDPVEDHFAAQPVNGKRSLRIIIFGPLSQHFACALESGDSLGKLSSDAHNLENRGNEHSEKNSIRNEGAGRHRAAGNPVRSDVENHCTDHAHKRG